MKIWIFFAVLLGGILYSMPAAAEEPALFVKLVYANYTNMDHWAKGYDPCHEFCETDFAKLIAAAHRKNMLDYDPICQCKTGGAKYMMFGGAQGVAITEFLVTMVKSGDPRTKWVVVLHWIDGGWQIHDILEKQNGKQVSIRQRLAGALT